MGRRSKIELQNLTERVVRLYQEGKTIVEIADILKTEGYDTSREGVRRAVRSAKDLAVDLKKATEEARVMMDAVRSSPNTDLAEAVLTRFASLLLQESSAIEELGSDDPMVYIDAISKVANAQAKLGTVRMKYQSGFEAAKQAVLEALKTELKNHPDILERLETIVTGLEAPAQ